MIENVFIVMRSGNPVGIFKDEEKADKYIEIQKLLNPSKQLGKLKSAIIDDSIDLNTEVKYYYNYTINTDDSIEQADDYNERKKQPKIFNGSQYTEVKHHNEIYISLPYYTISAYSIESYSKARELAIEQYKRIKGIS